MTLADTFADYWADEHGSPPPYEWVICSTCVGHGKHSRALGAFTADDLYELGDEFIRDYANGFYDKPCETCDGSGKVKDFTGPAGDEWIAWQDEDYNDRHTRMMESGQYG